MYTPLLGYHLLVFDNVFFPPAGHFAMCLYEKCFVTHIFQRIPRLFCKSTDLRDLIHRLSVAMVTLGLVQNETVIVKYAVGTNWGLDLDTKTPCDLTRLTSVEK